MLMGVDSVVLASVGGNEPATVGELSAFWCGGLYVLTNVLVRLGTTALPEGGIRHDVLDQCDLQAFVKTATNMNAAAVTRTTIEIFHAMKDDAFHIVMKASTLFS